MNVDREGIIKAAREPYNSYDGKKWRHDYFDKITGGYPVTDRKRIQHAGMNKQEAAKFKKEFDMAMVYAKNGYRIEMLEEKPGVPSPDVRINGILGELKRLSSHNNIAKEAKNAIRKQKSDLVLFQFEKMTEKIQEELFKLTQRGILWKYFLTKKETQIISSI